MITAEPATSQTFETLLGIDPLEVGREMHDLMSELFPIPRSITGDGVRRTHEIIGRRIPLETNEIPTGTKVFDWTVPKEWNVRQAYILGPSGEKVVDFADDPLHLVGYSIPIRQRLSLDQLRPHLHTLPEQPDAIPYRTSYYDEDWGFCLTERQARMLSEGWYEVVIDADLEDGSLTYSECLLVGELRDEVLISTYTCHPSLGNDNLSGVALVTALAERVAQVPRRYSYRFLFVPETIGAITWLALNEPLVPKIRHGLVVTCVGDAGLLTYKRSRRGNAEIDRAAATALRDSGSEHRILDFSPSGSDERQYCSPGFDLPVGSLMRTPYVMFPEYHTSLDDLSFVRPEFLGESLLTYLQILHVLERDRVYVNRNPKTEPQLGRRGLYRAIGGGRERDPIELAVRWVLNLSDGAHSLLDIAERSQMPFRLIAEAAGVLAGHDLLAPGPSTATPSEER